MVPVCEKCGRTMTPLFHPSWFCPPCENPSTPVVVTEARWKTLNLKWYYQLVQPGGNIPADATHGWWFGSSVDTDKAKEWLLEQSKVFNYFPWLGSQNAPITFTNRINQDHVLLAVFKR